jgi:hypothetical protein
MPFWCPDEIVGDHREGEGALGDGEAADLELAIPPMVLAQPNAASMRVLIRWLIGYQIPVHFRIVPDFPRTPSMKPSMMGVMELFERKPHLGERK